MARPAAVYGLRGDMLAQRGCGGGGGGNSSNTRSDNDAGRCVLIPQTPDRTNPPDDSVMHSFYVLMTRHMIVSIRSAERVDVNVALDAGVMPNHHTVSISHAQIQIW